MEPDAAYLYASGLHALEGRGLVDVGSMASWSVSSNKPGYGVIALRKDSPDTYWQSDGQQPHELIIRFTKLVAIERISLFLNYYTDESYTPSKIAVFAGSGDHDLIKVLQVEFDSPMGWRHIKFTGCSKEGVLKCHVVKLVFLANYQNGKDSHVRAVKVMSMGNHIQEGGEEEVGFTSIKFLSESVIR